MKNKNELILHTYFHTKHTGKVQQMNWERKVQNSHPKSLKWKLHVYLATHKPTTTGGKKEKKQNLIKISPQTYYPNTANSPVRIKIKKKEKKKK